MEEPNLKLTVEKGPREGETLECKPKSTIRIGRVVKGNTFTIKDAGISSKHLLIEFKEGKWVVSDLDTSNGTLLNGIQIEGMKAFGLKDGDVIKIGELTSLIVSVGEQEEEEESKKAKRGSKKVGKKGCGEVEVGEEVNQVKRYPGRSTRAATAKGKSVKSELGVDSKVQNVVGKANSELELCEEQANLGSLAVNRPRRGAGRLRKANKAESANVSETQNLGVESCKAEEDVNSIAVSRPRRGAARAARGTKAETLCVLETQKIGDGEKLDNVAPVEEKRTRRGAPKKTKGLNEEPVVAEIPTISERSNFGEDTRKEPENVTTVEEKQAGKVVVESVKASESAKVQVMEAPAVPGTSNLQKETRDESNENKVLGTGKGESVGNGINLEKMTEVPGTSNLQKETGDGSNENKNLDTGKGENIRSRIDLEKMTLGEWFDYLEVYLPKQIHETTDEIIAGMREQAKKFNEFMLEQQVSKGKLPMF